MSDRGEPGPARGADRPPRALVLAVAGLAVLGGGLASVALGQSVNWDLLNYHLYDPHAWVTGRWRHDVAPAQLQSYFNPLLHLPYYLGFRTLDHALLAFLTGAAQGTAGVPLFLLAWRALPAAAAGRTATALAVAALGLLGPIFVSELGTVFGDALLAPLVLASLLLVVRADGRAALAPLAGAGALAGGAVALKLPCAIYAPGLVLAHLALARDRRARVAGTAALAAGGLAGAALLGGFWAWHLWRVYENPLFPFFNDWFRSPWMRPWDFKDVRFLPRGWLEALAYPLVVVAEPARAMEKAFRDLRPAALWLALVALPVLAWRLALRPARPLAAVLVFAAATIVAWLAQFGIYRYLAVIEMLAPLALAGLALGWTGGGRAATAATLAVLAASQLAVVVPDWGRVPFGRLPARPGALSLAPGTMVLAAGGEPLGFLALALPDDVPFVRVASNFLKVDDGTGLAAAARRRVEAHPGPFQVLAVERELAGVGAEIGALGVAVDAASCRPVLPEPLPSLGSPIVLCDARRA